jgi:hypothetical protein
LTDATLDNGCIYLIPKNCAPVETDTAFRKAATVDKTIAISCCKTVARCRCAGTVFGWGSGVIHWGSACYGAGAPRLRSRKTFLPRIRRRSPRNIRSSTVAVSCRHIIAKAILAYQSFEALLIRYADFALELQKKTEATF